VRSSSDSHLQISKGIEEALARMGNTYPSTSARTMTAAVDLGIKRRHIRIGK